MSSLREKNYFAIEPAAIIDSLKHHWSLIAIAALVVPLFAAAISGYLPRQYEAQAKVFVQGSIAHGQFGERSRVQRSVKERMPLIETVLKSKRTMRTVLESLGELEPDASERKVQAKIDELAGQMSMWHAGHGLVTIRMRGNSPTRAYQALKQVVDTMIAETLRPQRETMKATTEFLQGQLARVREELKQREVDIQNLRGDNPEKLPEVSRVYVDSYVKIQNELLEARGAMQSKRTEMNALAARVRDYDPGRSELRRKLTEAESEVASMAAIYTPNHPKLVAARANRDALEDRWKQVGGDKKGTRRRLRKSSPAVVELQAVSAEVNGLQSKIDELGSVSQDLLAQIAETTRLERQLEKHERDNEVAVDVYKRLLTKYEDARVHRELALFDEERLVWVVEPPEVPMHPKGLPRVVIVFAAFVAGLVLGAGTALALDVFGPEYRSASALRRNLGRKYNVVEFPEMRGQDDG